MKYTHLENKHNLVAPRLIVPHLTNLLSPTSVIDVGCGLGTFLKAFKENNVETVKGLDGNWVDKRLLSKYLEESEFVETDLEQKFTFNEKYDLAISLEVAEHLSEKRAEGFVNDLTQLSDLIVFSAAIPGQGGDNHLNEQWIEYWQEKFESQGFLMCDSIRPLIWDENEIFWWYKQNMFLFINRQSQRFAEFEHMVIKNSERKIHPDLFEVWVNYKDTNAIKRYVKMLAKALGYRLGMYDKTK